LTETDLNEVRRYAADHLDRFVRELGQFLAIPSGAFEPGSLEAAARWLAAMAGTLGFSAELVPGYGPPVVLARRPGTGRGTVLFYGHYDVQPPGRAEDWTTPPFVPTVRHGRIFARGSGDNKGQLFAHLKAVEALDAVGCPPRATVGLLVEGEEEIGSPHLGRFVDEHRSRLGSDLLVIADGQNFFAPTPLVGLGTRGLLCARLTLDGPRRVLHSGNYGGLVENPALTLIRLVASLQDEDGASTIPGFSDGLVAPPGPVEGAEGDSFHFDPRPLADDVGGTVLAAGPSDPGWRAASGPVLNVSSFHAGDGGRTNIPTSATATIDFRLAYDQDPLAVFDALRRSLLAKRPGLRIELLRSLRPSRASLNNTQVRMLIRRIGIAAGGEPIVLPSLGCSGPDRVFQDGLGVPVVRLPYGDRDIRSHSTDESFSLRSLSEGIVQSAAAILSVGA
jgi:acetylornithine deacetylase/succinyl-diaminopimelate desuccinylase-like protein